MKCVSVTMDIHYGRAHGPKNHQFLLTLIQYLKSHTATSSDPPTVFMQLMIRGEHCFKSGFLLQS